MDSTRVQRLSSVVAIGVATQVSAELMQAKSSAHSFWLIVAISLGMMVVQVIFQELLKLRASIGSNWTMWITTLAQTVMGIETIIWTLYGTAIGQWILRMYLDLYTVPTFFYFLPLYAFLFGHFAVNASKVQQRTDKKVREEHKQTDIERRLDNLEKKQRVQSYTSIKVDGLMY